MSTTTTTTQTVPRYSIARTLADYDLHHSTTAEEKRDVEESNQNAQPINSSAEQASNPVNWETEYRRVPPHRPVNREIDVASRSITLNGAESFFVYNMFGGILMVERANRLWRATGGKLNDTFFRYAIGGEY